MTTLEELREDTTATGGGLSPLPFDSTQGGHEEQGFVVQLRGSTTFVTYPVCEVESTGGSTRSWQVSSPLDDVIVSVKRVGLRLRFLHVARPLERPKLPDEPPSALDRARYENRAVRAVADLRDWLGMSIAEVCDVVGLNESTVYNWVANPKTRPRPATVERLLTVWSLAGIAQEVLGESRARLWWTAGQRPRLETLFNGDRQALAALAEELSELDGATDALAPPKRALTADEAVEAMRRLAADDLPA